MRKPIVIETLVDFMKKPLKGQQVEVLPGEWIRLFGEIKKTVIGSVVPTTVPYSKTFKVGDTAWYFSTTGKIVSIGPKTVTLEVYGKNHRVPFEDFSMANYRFGLPEGT